MQSALWDVSYVLLQLLKGLDILLSLLYRGKAEVVIYRKQYSFEITGCFLSL